MAAVPQACLLFPGPLGRSVAAFRCQRLPSLCFHYFRLHSQGQFHCRTIRVHTLTPTCVLDSVQGGKVQTQRLLSRDTDEPMAWESCRPGRLLAGDSCTSSAKLLMTSDFLGLGPARNSVLQATSHSRALIPFAGFWQGTLHHPSATTILHQVEVLGGVTLGSTLMGVSLSSAPQLNQVYSKYPSRTLVGTKHL